MVAGLRVAYLTAALALLLLLPAGNVAILLVLFVAVDLAAAALMLRPAVPQARTVVMVGANDGSLALLRRTVPALRARRPIAAVEAQERWRQAVELRRQFRVVG